VTLTHGGAFAGYGGTHLAAALVLGPLDTRWVADIKPAAVRALAHLYPGVPNLGDIRFTHYGRQEPVDVRTDSWPCQPHSAAGKRLGSEDPRALWPYVARNIAHGRPAVWLGENVARCTSNGELRRVVRALADLGYVGAWRTQRASDLGACHRRDRLFVVAVDPRHPRLPAVADAFRDQLRHEQGRGGGPGGTGAGVAGHHGPERDAALTLLPTPGARDHKGIMPRGPRNDGHARTAAQLCLPGAVALLPTPGERLGSQRGVLNPVTAAARMASGRRNLDDAVALLPTPSARNARGDDRRGQRADGGGCAPDLQTVALTLQPERFGAYAPAIARHAALLGRPAPEPTMLGAKGSPQLNPWFVEWMMCLPEGHVCGLPDLGETRPASWRSRALSLIGDGVVPAQGAAAYRPLLAHLLGLAAA
jgi:DNA (cytosine-5)-methyltransferase 1